MHAYCTVLTIVLNTATRSWPFRTHRSSHNRTSTATPPPTPTYSAMVDLDVPLCGGGGGGRAGGGCAPTLSHVTYKAMGLHVSVSCKHRLR